MLYGPEGFSADSEELFIFFGPSILINEKGNKEGKGYLWIRTPLPLGGLLNSILISASTVS